VATDIFAPYRPARERRNRTTQRNPGKLPVSGWNFIACNPTCATIISGLDQVFWNDNRSM